MKHLRQLAVALALTIVLTPNAFAGELQTPPCAQPIPGELQTPPCASIQLPPEGSEIGQPPASEISAESLLTETAIDLLVSILSHY